MAKGFSDEVLRAIRERVDLVEVIGAYVALRRTGQNAVGLCPFHTEKRPSFTVSAAKQLYHCFGCGAGGDLFGFVMQRESVTFPEAVQLLARKAGVPLPDRDGSGVDRHRQTLYEIQTAASAHFRRRLEGREGEAARRYLRGRQLTPETMDAFGLGYAMSSWDDLLTALTTKGWTPQQVEEAGLAAPRTQGGGWYDRFRHRVICPIRDVHHNVVAFGGRVLDDALPKYLNSPDTPLFNKGRHLFGLDRAREAVASTGSLVVVEGYFDVMAAHQAGVRHVVATLGTALTPAHLEVIRRLVRRVVLVFDPDAAGVRAALRTIELFSPLDLHVEVVSLPGGKDPDRLIFEDGPDAFRAALESGVSLVAFVLDHLAPSGDYRRVEAKKDAVARALPVIAKLPNPIDRDHYRAWLADRVQVTEASLRDAMGRGAGPTPSRREAPSAPSPAASRPRAESMVAAALVQGRLAVDQVRGLGLEAFTDQAVRAVVELAFTAGGPPDAGAPHTMSASELWALASGRDDVARTVTELAVLSFSDDESGKEVEDCLIDLEISRCDRRIHDLRRSIGALDSRTDGLVSLQQELDRFTRAKARLHETRRVSARAVGG